MEDNDIENTQPAASKPERENQDETAPVRIHSTSENSAADLGVTRSTQIQPPFEAPVSNQPQTEAKPRRSRWWIVGALVGLVLLMLIALTSVYGGYLSAIQQRTAFQTTRDATEAQSQFALALVDIELKNFSQARQRLEYIIQIAPDFPGVGDKLAEVMVAMSITATPTPVPTPVPSPTLDLRDREELYLRGRELMAGADWSNAIDTLLALRKKDPTYMAVDVDGLLFVCLRNRGVEKISRHSDLEGGTYDLSLAEAFGPLDVEAQNWREWAVMYVRGASFWGVDWEKAVLYFQEIANIAPNLADASRIPAVERYYQALIKYGEWLGVQGRWCDAKLQFETAQNMRSDSFVQPTVDYVIQQCSSPGEPAPSSESTGATPTPTPTPSATPEGGGVVDTETPTPTPTTGTGP